MELLKSSCFLDKIIEGIRFCKYFLQNSKHYKKRCIPYSYRILPEIDFGSGYDFRNFQLDATQPNITSKNPDSKYQSRSKSLPIWSQNKQVSISIQKLVQNTMKIGDKMCKNMAYYQEIHIQTTHSVHLALVRCHSIALRGAALRTPSSRRCRRQPWRRRRWLDLSNWNSWESILSI